MTLTPCSRCARHVRATSSWCPFCSAPRDGVQPELHELPQGLSRTALLTLGASLTLGACAANEHPTVNMLPYGMPPMSQEQIRQGEIHREAASGVKWKLEATLSLTMKQRASWRLRVIATNTASVPAPTNHHELLFELNGKASMEMNQAFSNGTLDGAWKELPPGQSQQRELAVGEALFTAPGVYEIVIRRHEELGRLRVEVTGE